MSRKRCHRRPIVPLPPRGLRPKLAADQTLDLSLAHVANLDQIAHGTATEADLWDWAGGILTWSKVAELLQVGVDEMKPQLELASRLVERFGRTGRAVFTGPDYQLAKQGLDVMDELARLVDRSTAIAAADWSEAQIRALAASCHQSKVA